MHLTLIGMSNIGKTHWAGKLAAEGYEIIDCDLEIEKKLGAELTRLGYAGIHDVAKWMGQPYDPQYAETSAKFIACEGAVMQEAIEKLRAAAPGKRYAVDTSGSVIYIAAEIHRALRALTRAVYLEASAEHREQLFQSYIANPKPVVWGDGAFAPRAGETKEETLKRCYPQLLESRARRYEKLAHAAIPFARHRAANAGVKILF